MPINTTTISAGIAFYNASNVFLSGYARPVGTIGTVTMRYTVPIGAKYMRTTYWNATNRVTYGAFSCLIYYTYKILAWNKCPIKLWIGSLESASVLYPIALNFMQALKNYNANAQLRIIEGADHSITNGGNLVSDAEVITWFNKH